MHDESVHGEVCMVRVCMVSGDCVHVRAFVVCVCVCMMIMCGQKLALNPGFQSQNLDGNPGSGVCYHKQLKFTKQNSH